VPVNPGLTKTRPNAPSVPWIPSAGAFNSGGWRPFRNWIILGNTSRLESSMNTSTTDGGHIRLGGGFRLPTTSKITLGGGFRLPAAKPVNGKITLGGGFRLPAAR
jgi:hypothetical protein